MSDANEASFLLAIASAGDDNAVRLVFADWLEDRGESPRAAFIRVQCELASSRLADERRQALRVRERELLDAHRQEWCQSVGVPVEDVRFERGLIASMRLGQWDDGKMLEPVHAQRVSSLTELDLSGLRLGDDGLAAFAKTAQMPALRKLILSDNDITNAGAAALASAAGLPGLETIFLFKNSISDVACAALERSSHFRVQNLDVGKRAEGYCLSPGETEMARRHFLRTDLLPVVSGYFAMYEKLQSAMLCVAQYWADEANDAVHYTLIVSELFEPMMDGVGYASTESGTDPNLTDTRIKRKYGTEASSEVDFGDAGAQWDDNGGAIPLWAAFAPEAGSQEYESVGEVYAPAVMFYRHGGYDVLPMRRPHLDGVQPEWSQED